MKHAINTAKSVVGAVILVGVGLSTVLLPGAPSQAAAEPPQPILEYRFEEGSGPTVVNTGTFTGATGTLRDGFFVGSGPTFSPDQFNYTVDGTPGSTPLDQLTVEVWVKPATLSGQRVIWDDYGNPGVLFAIFNGFAQFSISTATNPGPGISLFVPGVLVTGEWQHMAGVYDGSKLRLFINGDDTCQSVETSGAIQDNSTVNPGEAPIAIGADSVTIPALNFQGLIDDVRLYPVALDRSQLAGGFFATVPTISCAARAIQALIAKVMALNLQKGIANSLDAKLDAALNALDDANRNNDVAAINTLDAFVNAVEAQRGTHITDADADALIAAAQDIITLLGG